MPYRKRPRAISTRYKRKRFRSRRRPMKKRSYRKKFKDSLVMPTSFMPSKTYAKCKYQETFIFTHLDNTVPTQLRFRGNNAYDPVFGIGGGNCTNYLGLSPPYRNATVMGSKIEVFYVDNGTSQTTPCQLTVIPLQDSEPVFDTLQLSQIGETKRATWRHVEPSNSSNFARGTIKKYMSTNKMFDTTKQEVKNTPDSYATGVASATQPDKGWLWYIYLTSPFVGAISCNCRLNLKVSITYYVMFDKLINQPL